MLVMIKALGYCRGVLFRLRRQCFCLVRAYIGAVSISCISIVGHFEISKKSNSVQTAWPKSTKLSGIIGLGHPT